MYIAAHSFIDVQVGVTEKSQGCDVNITVCWVPREVEPKYAILYFKDDAS